MFFWVKPVSHVSHHREQGNMVKECGKNEFSNGCYCKKKKNMKYMAKKWYFFQYNCYYFYGFRNPKADYHLLKSFERKEKKATCIKICNNKWLGLYW